MKIYSIIFRFLIIVFGLSLSMNLMPHSSAAMTEKVRIAVDEWPPFQSRLAQYYGGAHRIISESFELEGVTVEYGWFPWKRSLKNAKEGRWDGAFSQKSPEREKNFYFSEPIMTVDKVFFHLKSYRFDWANINDLNGVAIGVVRGNIFGKEFQDAWKSGMAIHI